MKLKFLFKASGLVTLIFIIIFSAYFIGAIIQSQETDIRYWESYDYQTGPSENKKNKSASDNQYLDYFFGDSAYNYLTYHYKNDGTVFFNGDIENVKKTQTINKEISLWKNDFASKQLIIFKTNNQLEIKNLKIFVVQTNINAPKFKANFILPIKSHNKIKKTSIYTGDYLSFDEISEQKSLKEMVYDFQPILFSAQSFDHAGNYTYQINLSFDVAGEKQNISIKQSVSVKNKDLSKNKEITDINGFNFDAMINPTQSQKFILSENKKKQSNTKEKLNFNNKYLSWETWDYIKYGNNQSFLKEENQKYFVKFYEELLEKSGMTYGYTPNFAINFIKFGLYNNGNIDDFIDLNAFNNYEYEDFFKSNSLEWVINFDQLDNYVNLLIQSGFIKLYIPVIARGTFPLPFVYSSKNYIIDNTNEPNPRLNIKTTFIDSNGHLTENANSFYEYFFPTFVKKLTNHIYQSYQKGKYLTNDKNLFQFYFSFDETNFAIDEKIINLTKKNDKNGVIKFHSFCGWEFQVNKNDYEDINKKLINEFDDITIQQREYAILDEGVLKYITSERKKQNKITKLYSTWKNYPAAYLGSNPAESFWGEIIASKLGFNGYNRHSLDYFSNNITEDKEDTTSINEPGDSYLIYPGKKNNPWYSLRLINFIESINLVIKEKALEKSKTSIFFPYDKVIKNVPNSNQNCNYKWNLNTFKSETDLKDLLNQNKNFSISEQVSIFKNWMYFNS